MYGRGLARKLVGKLTPYMDLFNQEVNHLNLSTVPLYIPKVQNYCGNRVLLDKNSLLRAESIRDIDRSM